jgi:hypothetical protein
MKRLCLVLAFLATTMSGRAQYAASVDLLSKTNAPGYNLFSTNRYTEWYIVSGSQSNTANGCYFWDTTLEAWTNSTWAIYGETNTFYWTNDAGAIVYYMTNLGTLGHTNIPAGYSWSTNIAGQAVPVGYYPTNGNGADFVLSFEGWNAPTNYATQLQWALPVRAQTAGVVFGFSPHLTNTSGVTVNLEASYDKTNWYSLTNITYTRSGALTSTSVFGSYLILNEAGWLRVYNVTNVGFTAIDDFWIRLSHK